MTDYLLGISTGIVISLIASIFLKIKVIEIKGFDMPKLQRKILTNGTKHTPKPYSDQRAAEAEGE